MSKKLLAAVLALSLVMSLLFVPAAAATTFDDVAEDHWASSSIERWADYGVLTGHGDGTFTPDVVMTRAEFAAMLVKMLGLTAKSETKFTDVTDDHWAAEVISIAVKAGIINGVGDNKFDPDIPVSFEEAAVMMCRAFGLAKNTSGTDWSKESIEKLTSLGMIGEGADEHLQVGVECNRAVVAKLADTMVAEYVAEDRATPITGEVKGVVLVVKGAKAEIKDATLAAPVVAESASVTLTNTKADAVIVSGKDAAVTADEQSTVASVTLAGEAPKADIKGEVASVTVAEETKGAVIEAPKAADNAIVNNSGTDITVNGETVSNKADDTPNNPADTTTDTTKTDEHVHKLAYVPNADASTWNHTQKCIETKGADKCKFAVGDPVACTATLVYEQTTVTEGETVSPAHIQKCSLCGKTSVATKCTATNNGKCVCGYMVTPVTTRPSAGTPTHDCNFEATDAAHVTITKAATCTAPGQKVIRCKVTSATVGGKTVTFTCNATKTESIPVLGHDWNANEDGRDANGYKTVKNATCELDGQKTRTCERCKISENQTITKLGHTKPEKAAMTKTATQHTWVCTTCHKSFTEGHTWNTSNGKCTVCDYQCTHSYTYETNTTGEGNTHKKVCSKCGYTVDSEGCTMVEVANSAVAATCTTAGKAADTKCSKCGKTVAGAATEKAAHTYNANGWAPDNPATTTTGSGPDAKTMYNWQRVCTVCGGAKQTQQTETDTAPTGNPPT